MSRVEIIASIGCEASCLEKTAEYKLHWKTDYY